MSIHEQITALLDGELADAGAVAELMHVLAVSPEKRDLLVEQLSLKRQFTSAAATVVPPSSADLSIMRGLGSVDAGFGGAASGDQANDPHDDVAPAPIPVSLPASIFGLSRFVAGTIAVMLTMGAFGAGYLIRGNSTSATNTVAQAPVTGATLTSNDNAALAGARDSIGVLEQMVESMSDSIRSAQLAVARSSNRRVVERVYVEQPETAARVSAAVSVSADRPLSTSESSDGVDASRVGDQSRSISMTHLLPPHQRISRTSRVFAAPIEQPTTSSIVTAPMSSDSKTPLGIQVGLRNHFRLSLPRVYGLAQPAALLDRELVGSYEFGGDKDGMLSRVRAGAALGQTQFSQILHSNTGGEPVDTIFEQSPQPYYGRVFVAPELIRSKAFAGLIEVGGGYSQVGGFGTVGLNFEYRPIASVALHAGASSWLLWSRFRGAVSLSTNLNAHVGAMFGF